MTKLNDLGRAKADHRMYKRGYTIKLVGETEKKEPLPAPPKEKGKQG